jgi:uncharacterized protein (DUF4415 family)
MKNINRQPDKGKKRSNQDPMSLLPIKRGWKPKPRLNGDSIKKTRGRPKKNPDMLTIKPVRLSQDMIENFELWKSQYNVRTYDEAIRMRLADESHTKKTLRKKVDALLKEQKQYPMAVNK